MAYKEHSPAGKSPMWLLGLASTGSFVFIAYHLVFRQEWAPLLSGLKSHLSSSASGHNALVHLNYLQENHFTIPKTMAVVFLVLHGALMLGAIAMVFIMKYHQNRHVEGEEGGMVPPSVRKATGEQASVLHAAIGDLKQATHALTTIVSVSPLPSLNRNYKDFNHYHQQLIKISQVSEKVTGAVQETEQALVDVSQRLNHLVLLLRQGVNRDRADDGRTRFVSFIRSVEENNARLHRSVTETLSQTDVLQRSIRENEELHIPLKERLIELRRTIESNRDVYGHRRQQLEKLVSEHGKLEHQLFAIQDMVTDLQRKCLVKEEKNCYWLDENHTPVLHGSAAGDPGPSPWAKGLGLLTLKVQEVQRSLAATGEALADVEEGLSEAMSAYKYQLTEVDMLTMAFEHLNSAELRTTCEEAQSSLKELYEDIGKSREFTVKLVGEARNQLAFSKEMSLFIGKYGLELNHIEKGIEDLKRHLSQLGERSALTRETALHLIRWIEDLAEGIVALPVKEDSLNVAAYNLAKIQKTTRELEHFMMPDARVACEF